MYYLQKLLPTALELSEQYEEPTARNRQAQTAI